MKIEIVRFKVTVHGEAPLHVLIEAPHPDEAMSKVRREHKLPIRTRLTATKTTSKWINLENL